jgi:hypothetical protein
VAMPTPCSTGFLRGLRPSSSGSIPTSHDPRRVQGTSLAISPSRCHCGMVVSPFHLPDGIEKKVGPLIAQRPDLSAGGLVPFSCRAAKRSRLERQAVAALVALRRRLADGRSPIALALAEKPHGAGRHLVAGAVLAVVPLPDADILKRAWTTSVLPSLPPGHLDMPLCCLIFVTMV